MKFKENEHKDSVIEEVIEIMATPEDIPSKESSDSGDVKDTYLRIIKTHLSIIEDSFKVVKHNFNKLCGCGGEDND